MTEPPAATLPEAPPAEPWSILGMRFVLELVGWTSFGIWGWSIGDGSLPGGFLAVSFVAVSVAAWGVFRVPNDPPGKLDPPIRVSGWARLAVELAFFALAAPGLWLSGYRAASETLLTAVSLLYVVTWDRQRWLVQQ
ncbi:MAG TPA: YrdB family protein [Thermomicrobiales bacterium]|nr:YrdB family protein [Thermomicrobiales bacterium]